MNHIFKITVKGKRQINQELTFSTDYNNYHIKSIKWDLGNGTKANTKISKSIFHTSGPQIIKCVINHRYVLKKRIVIQPLTNDPESIILRFINNSVNANFDTVVFQRNVAANFDDLPIAWHLLSFNKIGQSKYVIYDPDLEIAFYDTLNNYSSKLSASAGQQFLASAENTLTLNGAAASSKEIELLSSISSDSITAVIYRSNKIVTQKNGIMDGQKSIFELKPTIWVGTVSGVSQGDILSSDIVSQVNTEISLLGIKSTDIVITGGGSDPYEFSLNNIIF